MNHLLYGAAYYDEYMPYDRLDEDIRMMKEAGINLVRIAESTWSTCEPQEGKFDFSHVVRVLDAMEEAGIDVIIGTPTYAIPTWMVKSYPDVLATTKKGKGIYGARQIMDITHPVYRYYGERVIRRLMEVSAHRKCVIGYQVDNETKYYDTAGRNVQEQFVKYLRTKFHDDLDAMNSAFGMDYWSNRINAWEDFPDVRGTVNGSLGAEFEKFQRTLVDEFLEWQARIVREYMREDQFITHNFDFGWKGGSYGVQPKVNHYHAAGPLTVAGVDIYHPTQDELTGAAIAYCGDSARSLKRDNYFVLETEAQGFPQWLPYDGQLRLQAYSHVASGANMVEYWHWHSIHNAIESYWKGVLSHNFKENATYREVCRIGADFAKYSTHLVNLKKRCSVGILLDNVSLDALRWFSIPNGPSYNDIFRWVFDALYELNVECDILSPNDIDLFSQYKLIVTPALYSVSDELVDALKAYVKKGGVLLSTFKTAVADRMLKIYHDDLPHGLTEVFGMTYDQFTDGVSVGLKKEPGSHVRHWMELLLPDRAETLDFYDHPHWGDCAAITGNRFGQGYAAYLGCYTDSDILKKLLVFLCAKANVPMEEAVYPLVIRRGTNGLQKEVIYYFNYSENATETFYHGPDARVLLTGHEAFPSVSVRDGDLLTLHCWDFLILEEV